MEERGINDEQEETEQESSASSNRTSNTNRLTERLTISEWDVDESSMDDDQLDLIERTLDKSMLVAGCAGSGKSVIAMHKAEQIAQAGYSVILIA